jgi:hypothetical protein
MRRFEDGTIPARKNKYQVALYEKSLDACLDSPDNSRGSSNDR